MLLTNWLNRLCSSNKSTRRQIRRNRNQKLPCQSEVLEDRALLTTLIWEGDVDANWSTNNAGDTNWMEQGTGNQLTPQDGDTLIFDATTAGNFTNNNDTPAFRSYQLQFDSSGYTINGNLIFLDLAGTDVTDSAGGNTINAQLSVLNTDGVIDVSMGNTLTIAAVTSGGRTLQKIGAGTLIVNSQSNSNVDIQSGTLQKGSASALPGSGTVNIGVSGTLDVNGFGGGIANLRGDAGALITNSTTTNVTFTIGAAPNGAGGTYNGVIEDGNAVMSFFVSGAGASLTLGGVNTYTGTTNINSNFILNVAAGGEIGNGGPAGTTTITNLGILNTAGIINAPISGGNFASVINATGDTTLGSSSLMSGFSTGGILNLDGFEVTLHDANVAVLGATTDLGSGGVLNVSGTGGEADGVLLSGSEQLIG